MHDEKSTMDEEERYRRIVESRKAEPEDGAKRGGVGPDPHGEDKTVGDDPGEGSGQREPDKGTERKTDERTAEERQQHAIAAMRVRFKRENDALRREIAELKKAAGTSAGERPKTRADFKDDAEYGTYLRQSLEDDVYRRVRERVDGDLENERSEAEEYRRLEQGLENVQKGLGGTVMRELRDPESEMSLILTDERAEAMADAIRQSPDKAEILAVMYGNPDLFRKLLDLPPRKQAYRIFQLEDRLEAMRREGESKAKAEEERRKRAEAVPAPGAFGVTGNGRTNIGSLSATERVKRYREEMRKSGII